MVRLSALRTGHLYPPGNIPGTHFCWRLSRLQGHSAVGRIMSYANIAFENVEISVTHVFRLAVIFDSIANGRNVFSGR